MITDVIVIDTVTSLKSSVWHAGVDPAPAEPDSPWNSSNETPTDSWEFTESDYVAELIFA